MILYNLDYNLSARDLGTARSDGNDRVRVYRLARTVFRKCDIAWRYEIFPTHHALNLPWGHSWLKYFLHAGLNFLIL